MDASARAESRFHVAPASLTDLPAILRQQRACFGRDGYDIFTLLGMSLTLGMVRLKAVADGRLVGYLAAEHIRTHQCGWIITIGVMPSHTGLGIGTALMLAAEQQLRESTIKLTVRSGNQRAIDMYERIGYRWRSTHPRYYRDGEDGRVMEKVTAPNDAA
jgi:[ribosomal protein S18]-alanine N-acetyltransferase